ncbi:hypothetical protein LINPERPRIM_LOCUS18716 [Linum perenne]
MISSVVDHTMSQTWHPTRSRIVLCMKANGAKRVPLLSGTISMVVFFLHKPYVNTAMNRCIPIT